jgi:hypothetical protein
MARIEIEDFSDKDISRIFIARNIREAERAEMLLRENGISYAVEIEEFVGAGPFAISAKNGVAFYVLSGERNFCRDLFFRNHLKSGWIGDTD